MLLGLLLEALFEHFENFLNALFLIALRAQELAELLHCGGRVVEPVHQLLGKLVLIWHAVEVFQEDLVELVVIRLGLDEHRAAELVKARERIVLQVQHQPLDERHPLIQADAKAVRAQKVEKSSKHGVLIFSVGAARWRYPCPF